MQRKRMWVYRQLARQAALGQQERRKVFVDGEGFSYLGRSYGSVAEWGAVFGDAVVATASLDRLLHHSHVITIRGDSYRLRSKRRAGLVNQASAKEAVTTD